MKISIFLVVLLVSITAVFAQYCPSPKAVTGEHTERIFLNDHETGLWIEYGNNVDALRRVASQRGWRGSANAVQAHNDLQVLQGILGRVEQAVEKGKLAIGRRLLSEKCKTAIPVKATGWCHGQLVMSPDWKKDVSFRPEGVYAAALTVVVSGNGECSYFGKDIAPKEKPSEPPTIVTEQKGPYFDCNNIVPLAMWSRSYTSMHKGKSSQFRVFSYRGWEIHCANVGGNFWEIAKKVEYPAELPVIQPAPITGDAVGRVLTVKQLPEGQLKGIIARIDGKSPNRLNYIVKDIELRQGQKVKFAKSATGLVTAVEVVS
jgi:hypothetical protein